MTTEFHSPNTELTLPSAAKIISVENDNFRTKTYTLDAAIPAQPGQFIMVWLPGFDEKPFSLVNNDPVTIMITAIGPFTRLIHKQQPGDRLWIRGPFGNGFSVAKDLRHVLLVGGGYGVAPLFYLARKMSGSSIRISAVIGAKTQRELLYLDRFQALAHNYSGTQCNIYVTTDDGSFGQQGFVIGPVTDLLQQEGIDHIYACGPHTMLEALRQLGSDVGVSTQLSWEAYMRCGMGLCGSCELENKLLCMDGPVLSY